MVYNGFYQLCRGKLWNLSTLYTLVTFTYNYLNPPIAEVEYECCGIHVQHNLSTNRVMNSVQRVIQVKLYLVNERLYHLYRVSRTK